MGNEPEQDAQPRRATPNDQNVGDPSPPHAELGDPSPNPEDVEPMTNDKAGKINFDDRGNAFFEWRDDLIVEDNDAAQRRRDKALENPGLSLVNEGLPPSTDAGPRDYRSGYNPYESGVLDRATTPPRKKRDLRELSKWIEAKRKAEQTSNKN